jgi:4'-phosphopantetheinyl transferase EntD
VVGSITHTASYCAVVVMPSPPWRSVGLDAEELRRLEPGVVELITTDGERQWLADLPPGAHDDNALLLFSAKEAYFKLQYPLTGRFLDFPEVQIHADPLAGTFQAIARVEMPSSLANVSGRFAMAEGKVLCGMQLL